MRIIPDQLKSKNLVPFRKRHGRYKIPGMTSENEALMTRVEADLSPEEQSYVRHYLGYADTFIRMAEANAPPETETENDPATPSTEEGQKPRPPSEQQDTEPIDDRPARAA